MNNEVFRRFRAAGAAMAIRPTLTLAHALSTSFTIQLTVNTSHHCARSRRSGAQFVQRSTAYVRRHRPAAVKEKVSHGQRLNQDSVDAAGVEPGGAMVELLTRNSVGNHERDPEPARQTP